MLSWGRFDADPKVPSTIRDSAEQLRPESDPRDAGVMAWPGDQWDEGEGEDVHAIGYTKRKAKGKGTAQGTGAN